MRLLDPVVSTNRDLLKSYGWKPVDDPTCSWLLQSGPRKKVNRLTQIPRNLGNLTSFFNRHYRSDYGAQSSITNYSRSAFRDVHTSFTLESGVHVSLETFTHSFPRPNPGIKLPLIIFGANQDSANYAFPFLPAPGADDDGSGTVTILEAFRTLVQAGFQPECLVEFHLYAAEEAGGLGSQDIVTEYIRQRKDVGAMIQSKTAHVPKGAKPTVTFITADVNTLLTDWAMKMAAEYTSLVAGAKLTSGTGSDHMAWHRAGFSAIFAMEGDPFQAFSPYIHTADDGEFSFEFVKVAVGFAVEWVK